MDERESKNTGSVDTVNTTVLAKLLIEKHPGGLLFEKIYASPIC